MAKLRMIQQKAKLLKIRVRVRIPFLLAFILFARLATSSPYNIDLSGSFKAIGEYEQLRQLGVYRYDSVPLTEERLRLQGVVSNQWLRLEAANELSFVYQKYNPSYLLLPDVNPTSAWN